MRNKRQKRKRAKQNNITHTWTLQGQHCLLEQSTQARTQGSNVKPARQQSKETSKGQEPLITFRAAKKYHRVKRRGIGWYDKWKAPQRPWKIERKSVTIGRKEINIQKQTYAQLLRFCECKPLPCFVLVNLIWWLRFLFAFVLPFCFKTLFGLLVSMAGLPDSILEWLDLSRYRFNLSPGDEESLEDWLAMEYCQNKPSY